MQADRPKYLNPPIRLASCSLALEAASGLSDAAVEKLHAQLHEQYDGLPFVEVPEEEYARTLTPKTTTSALILRTKDDSRSVKFSPHEIIVRTLAPYDGWEQFLDRIRVCVNAWKSVSEQSQLRRVSLYYQNLIPLESDESQIEEYFTVIPRSIDTHFVRSQFYYSSDYIDEHDRGLIEVTLVKFPPRKDEAATLFILQLDSKSPVLESTLPLSEFEQLIVPVKARTNVAFESLITHKMRERFGSMRRSTNA